MKICPLKSSRYSSERDVECNDYCAWYDKEEKRCIIYTIYKKVKDGLL